LPPTSTLFPYTTLFRSPPLQFGRRPPQSNCPADIVPEPDYGSRLELQYNKSGISLTTPGRLAPPSQSLPPMLHMLNQSSVSTCRDRKSTRLNSSHLVIS